MTKIINVYKYKSKDPSLSKVSDVGGLNHNPHLINSLVSLEVLPSSKTFRTFMVALTLFQTLNWTWRWTYLAITQCYIYKALATTKHISQSQKKWGQLWNTECGITIINMVSPLEQTTKLTNHHF
jgi:hypothetical protein